MYCQKIIWHYKLLRIEQDGGVNKDEDYLMSWFTNRYFDLKLKSGSLSMVEAHSKNEDAGKYVNKINSLITMMGWVFIFFLLMVLYSMALS